MIKSCAAPGDYKLKRKSFLVQKSVASVDSRGDPQPLPFAWKLVGDVEGVSVYEQDFYGKVRCGRMTGSWSLRRHPPIVVKRDAEWNEWMNKQLSHWKLKIPEDVWCWRGAFFFGASANKRRRRKTHFHPMTTKGGKKKRSNHLGFSDIRPLKSTRNSQTSRALCVVTQRANQ